MIIENSKSELRNIGKNIRSKIDPFLREKYSHEINQYICTTDYFLNAENISFYLPMKDEVDVWPLIEQSWKLNKNVFVPSIRNNATLNFHKINRNTEYITNNLGLNEPINGERKSPTDLDVVITPLVVFDNYGNRIGMGGGYYDKTFAFLNGSNAPFKTKLIGVSFACQKVKNIKKDSWDVNLFQVITEKGPAY
tara:strand:+ start:1248 stop:1829 length:582 start_codon:yes stop_codon:yes gene_type:complete